MVTRGSGTTLHSAPLIVPVGAPPVRFGAVAVRDGVVVALGPRKELAATHPRHRELRWPGMIVAGLVDAGTRICASPTPAATARELLGCGVTTVAEILGDPDAVGPLRESGLGGVAYVEVRCPDERYWEEQGRDRLITAIRELDYPVGIAPDTRDPAVLEDLALLARTFGLRLHADLAAYDLAALDDAGVLGPHTHLALAGPLDTGERKLLRMRGTTVAVDPSAVPEETTALLEEGNRVALRSPEKPTDGEPGPLAAARAYLSGAFGRTRRSHEVARWLVEAATLGGARALGLASGLGRIGSLLPGCRADFAVFAVKTARRDPYTALIEDGPGNCVATVGGGEVRWEAA